MGILKPRVKDYIPLINAIDQARRDYLWKGSDVNGSQTLLLPGIRLLV
jgi:hypothetical protein